MMLMMRCPGLTCCWPLMPGLASQSACGCGMSHHRSSLLSAVHCPWHAPGSAHFVNKADNVIAVHRQWASQLSASALGGAGSASDGSLEVLGENDVQLFVQKVRMRRAGPALWTCLPSLPLGPACC